MINCNYWVFKELLKPREDNLVIEIAENVEITILRTAVGHVIEEEDEEINEDEEIEEDGEIEEESTEK